MDMKTLFANVTVSNTEDFNASNGKGIQGMPSTCVDELANFVQKLTSPVVVNGINNGIPMTQLSMDYTIGIPIAYSPITNGVILRKNAYITNIEYEGDHIVYIGIDLWSSGTYTAPGGVIRLCATLPEAIDIIWQFVNGTGTGTDDRIYIGGPRSYNRILY